MGMNVLSLGGNSARTHFSHVSHLIAKHGLVVENAVVEFALWRARDGGSTIVKFAGRFPQKVAVRVRVPVVVLAVRKQTRMAAPPRR